MVLPVGRAQSQQASDGPNFRRARAIGLIYAAGRLASAWGVLPLKQLKKPLLECYRRSASTDHDQTRQLTAPERIEIYVQANQSKLRDLDKRKPRMMGDAALNAHPGFLMSIKGSRYLLIRRERLEKLFGADTDRVIDGMKGLGRLYSTDGNQAQKRVRKNQPKDRVYAFQLD